MKKQALAIALASVVGTFATAGYAQEPPTFTAPSGTSPALYDTERSAFCLIESALSIVASKIAYTTCIASKGSYELYVVVNEGADGTAQLDSVSLSNKLDPKTNLGQKCTVTQKAAGKLDLPFASGGTPIESYLGEFYWKINSGTPKSAQNSSPMMVGDATLNVGTTRTLMDEHIIKDFYVPCSGGSSCKQWTAFDYGMEAITKKHYPREKWWQRSKYDRENGADGFVWMEKTRLEPKSPSCTITLDPTFAYFDGGNFSFYGAITVK
jgi:hypothetical protein